MEIPLQIGKRQQASSDTGANFFAGTVIGIGKALQRTLVGALEIVTFPIPFEGNAPLLPTLDYFDKNKATERLPLQ
jgi:putative exosortase-associated protein (TIGR04073 family)